MEQVHPNQPLFMAFTAYEDITSAATYEVVVDMSKFISLEGHSEDPNYSNMYIKGRVGTILLHGTPKAILGIE